MAEQDLEFPVFSHITKRASEKYSILKEMIIWLSEHTETHDNRRTGKEFYAKFSQYLPKKLYRYVKIDEYRVEEILCKKVFFF